MSESYVETLKSLFSRILAAAIVLPALWMKVDGKEDFGLCKFLGLDYDTQYIPLLLAMNIVSKDKEKIKFH